MDEWMSESKNGDDALDHQIQFILACNQFMT